MDSMHVDKDIAKPPNKHQTNIADAHRIGQQKKQRKASAANAGPLQRLADQSCRTSGSALQRMQVMQLQLDANRLNVVGENHLESGQRRVAEAALAAQETGGKYYTENQFFARVRNFGELFDDLFGRDREERPYADPLYLRMAQHILFIDRYNNFVGIDQWNLDLPEAAVHETRDQIIGLYQNNVAGITAGVGEINALIGLTHANKEKDSYDEARVAQLNMMITRKDALVQRLVTFDDVLASIDHNVDALPEAFTQSLNELTQAITALVQVGIALGGATLDETRIRRSNAMHEVANRRHRDKGLWKVGQGHFEDLPAAELRHYNAMSRDEFNAHYQQLPVLGDDDMVHPQ